MSVTLTKLKQRATNEYVDAEIHDTVLLSDMIVSEKLWQSDRLRIGLAFQFAGIQQNEWPQHLHWN